jgi:acyl transferase domain-containing protein
MILMNAGAYIGLAAAGMLGRAGRSLTFDMSANGYARGDAQCACIFKVAESSTEIRDRSGVFLGGFVNQDGRSASLTAPNGPSQKLCCEMSHRLNNVKATEVNTQENHGTGTALGDPIEVGSMISVYKKGRGDRPITLTGGKSNQGHSEGCAGLSGILKSLNTLLHSTTPPQCHLGILNHHIDEVGFPGLFPTENVDQNLDVQGCIAGLNSFGFGGTNSHGELWARPRSAAEDGLAEQKRSSQQQKVTAVVTECRQCGGPMCYTCGQAFPAEPNSTKIHRCADIRTDTSSYDICSLCYKGGYYYRGADSLAMDSLKAIEGRQY